MPEHYNEALIIARLIRECTDTKLMYLDIANILQQADGNVLDLDDDDEVRLTFVFKKTKGVQ
jgi:hypothetical protein